MDETPLWLGLTAWGCDWQDLVNVQCTTGHDNGRFTVVLSMITNSKKKNHGP